MTTCRVCGAPMAERNSWGNLRTCCSQRCAVAAGNVVRAAREAQVDPAAVDRLVHGEPVTSTRAERLEACRILRARGRSYTQVATALRVTPHSVWRYVVQLRNERKAA